MVLFKVNTKKSDRKINPQEMAPHDMQPGDRLQLGEVKNGLGSDSGSETVGEVDLPETTTAQSLALNKVGKAIIAQLLFRERLWSKGDAEVGEAGTSLSNYGDCVVVTKITEKYQMNIILSPDRHNLPKGKPGEVGKAGEKDLQLRLPRGLCELKEETQPFLVHLSRGEGKVGDMRQAGLLLHQVLKDQVAPVVAQELLQSEVCAREESQPGVEYVFFYRHSAPHFVIVTHDPLENVHSKWSW